MASNRRIRKDIAALRSQVNHLALQMAGFRGALTYLTDVGASMQQNFDDVIAKIDELELDEESYIEHRDLVQKALEAEVADLTTKLANNQPVDTSAQVARLQKLIDAIKPVEQQS
jgi:hypothetical protein